MDSFNKSIMNLPESLSKDEQNQLLKEFYETRDPAIREKLITHNLRLVAYCVSQSNKKYDDWDDLMQIGTIELINVLDNKFDLSKVVSNESSLFSTFAVSSIKGRFKNLNRGLDVLYRSDWESKQFNSSFNENQDKSDIFNTISSGENIAEEVASQDQLDRILSVLNNEERYIIEHTVGLNDCEVLTYKEIANNLGEGTDKIRRDTFKIYAKLIEQYKKQNFETNDDEKEDEETKLISEYIKTIDNQKHIDVLSRYFGLNGFKKTKNVEICAELSLKESTVSNIVKCALAKCSAKSNDNIEEDVEKYISNSKDSFTNFVANYLLGLNGRPRMTRPEFTKTFAIPSNVVGYVFTQMHTNMRKEKQKQQEREKVVAFLPYVKSDRDRQILEDFYGINGKQELTIKEIAEKYQLKISVVYSIFRDLRKSLENFNNETLGSRGSKISKFTLDQINEFYENVADETERIFMENYYGLNGSTQKGFKEIAKILNVKVSYVGLIHGRIKDKMIESEKEQID